VIFKVCHDLFIPVQSAGIYSVIGSSLLPRLDDVPPSLLASAAVAICRGGGGGGGSGGRGLRFFTGLLEEAAAYPSRFTPQHVGRIKDPHCP
jgi:hypothetical protein